MEAEAELVGSLAHPGQAVKPTVHQGEVRVAEAERQLPQVLGEVDAFHEGVSGDAEGQGHGLRPHPESLLTEATMEPQGSGF